MTIRRASDATYERVRGVVYDRLEELQDSEELIYEAEGHIVSQAEKLAALDRAMMTLLLIYLYQLTEK